MDSGTVKYLLRMDLSTQQWHSNMWEGLHCTRAYDLQVSAAHGDSKNASETLAPSCMKTSYAIGSQIIFS